MYDFSESFNMDTLTTMITTIMVMLFTIRGSAYGTIVEYDMGSGVRSVSGFSITNYPISPANLTGGLSPKV